MGLHQGVLQPGLVARYGAGQMRVLVVASRLARMGGLAASGVESRDAGECGGVGWLSVVVGGTGSLGRLVRRWLAERGAGHVQVLGRSGHEGASEYGGCAAAVSVVRADAASAEEMAAIANLECGQFAIFDADVLG